LLRVLQILLVGDSGVGKSSLLLRFATGGFEELTPTIGYGAACRRLPLSSGTERPSARLSVYLLAVQRQLCRALLLPRA